MLALRPPACLPPLRGRPAGTELTICNGTDKASTARAAVCRADATVVFSWIMWKKAKQCIRSACGDGDGDDGAVSDGSTKERVVCIAQAVDAKQVLMECGGGVGRKADIRTELGLAPDTIVFLLPAGLRSVKDPLFLVASIQHVRSRLGRDNVHCVLIGTVLDKDVAAQVRVFVFFVVLRVRNQNTQRVDALLSTGHRCLPSLALIRRVRACECHSPLHIQAFGITSHVVGLNC